MKLQHYWFCQWWKLRKKYLKLQEECRGLRRQRDCLHKHFYDLAQPFKLMPKELVEVLDEIEGEDDAS